MRGGARRRHRTYALFAGVCIGIRLPASAAARLLHQRNGPHSVWTTHARTCQCQSEPSNERTRSECRIGHARNEMRDLDAVLTRDDRGPVQPARVSPRTPSPLWCYRVYLGLLAPPPRRSSVSGHIALPVDTLPELEREIARTCSYPDTARLHRDANGRGTRTC